MDSVLLSRGFSLGPNGFFGLVEELLASGIAVPLIRGGFISQVENNEPDPDLSGDRFANESDRKRSDLSRSAGWSSLGWQLLLTFVIFAAAGQWLDGELDSGPWGVLGGCLLGFVALIVRALRESDRK